MSDKNNFDDWFESFNSRVKGGRLTVDNIWKHEEGTRRFYMFRAIFVSDAGIEYYIGYSKSSEEIQKDCEKWLTDPANSEFVAGIPSSEPTFAQLMEWQNKLNEGQLFKFHIEISNGVFMGVFNRLWRIKDVYGHREQENYCFMKAENISMFMECVELWMKTKSGATFEGWRKNFEYVSTYLGE